MGNVWGEADKPADSLEPSGRGGKLTTTGPLLKSRRDQGQGPENTKRLKSSRLGCIGCMGCMMAASISTLRDEHPRSCHRDHP